jgi:hypothetical protein
MVWFSCAGISSSRYRVFMRGAKRATAVALGIVIACSGSDDGNRAGGGPGAADGGGASSGGPRDGGVLADGAVAPTTTCVSEGGTAAVQKPTFVRNLSTGETGWFASPALVDLDGDTKLEIVAASYSTFVFDASGKKLAKATATQGRVYAPHVVADLDGDGKLEIVVGGNEGTIAAYNYAAGALTPKWTASTTSGGQSPEARGMAAGDLDGDGKIEVVVTTTNTSPTGSQVFVFEPDGKVRAGWPRYDGADDKTFNGQGNSGYGCYGLNVGIGNVDEDAQLEVVATYDNHQINVFDPDGSSLLASDWYTNPANEWLGQRMGWGQFIRWADLKVEDDHYHGHLDPWPSVTTTMWLQWTASPPNVVDLDGDGRNEIVGIPNAELKEPYETQAYAFMALDTGKDRAARRHAGFETLPMSDKPAVRANDDYYPPSGVPAPTTVSIVGDARPEIIAPINDGYVYAIGPTASVSGAMTSRAARRRPSHRK